VLAAVDTKLKPRRAVGYRAQATRMCRAANRVAVNVRLREGLRCGIAVSDGYFQWRKFSIGRELPQFKRYSPSASNFQASSRSSGTYLRSLFFLTQSLSCCEHK
jgi:hypothetical protein